MRQNSQATVSAAARHPQPRQWASRTMKSSCWADGAATLTSYISIIHKPGCSLYLPAYIGPLHTVSLSSLCLSSSHLIWLEHGPTRACKRAEATTIILLSAIHKQKHRRANFYSSPADERSQKMNSGSTVRMMYDLKES